MVINPWLFTKTFFMSEQSILRLTVTLFVSMSLSILFASYLSLLKNNLQTSSPKFICLAVFKTLFLNLSWFLIYHLKFEGDVRINIEYSQNHRVDLYIIFYLYLVPNFYCVHIEVKMSLSLYHLNNCLVYGSYSCNINQYNTIHFIFLSILNMESEELRSSLLSH